MKTNLRSLRTASNITQAELSRMTGISQTAICLYEKEKIGMSLRNAAKITEALGVTLNDLVCNNLSMRRRIKSAMEAKENTSRNFQRFAEEQRQSVSS